MVRNFTDTVFPLYDDTVQRLLHVTPRRVDVEYVASVEVVVPLTTWTLVVS